MKNRLFILMILFPLLAFGQEEAIQKSAHDISQHYAALPVLYHFDGVQKEQLSDKITRQYVMGAQSMIVKWTLLKGAVVPLHFHPNEQITWITKGSVKVVSQGKEFIVKAGDVFIIPPYVPHVFYALEDTIDIDYFTPVRQDWLNNSAGYIQSIQKKSS